MITSDFIRTAISLTEDCRVVRKKDVPNILGVSKSTVTRLIKDEKLPKPLKIGKRARGFLLSTLKAYLGSVSQ